VPSLTITRLRPTPEQFVQTFGGAPALAHVDAGTFLEVFTEDCYAGWVRDEAELPSAMCPSPLRNPLTGPIYVNGAEPGDRLAVHFVRIEPARNWAVSATVPSFGALTSTQLTASLQPPLDELVWRWTLDLEHGTCTFHARDSDARATVPMDPMHGTVGVAPANGEVRSSLVPGTYGGNLDTPEIREGVTCYFGVNVEGAMLSLGDGHARQGEGETCGVAVECAMNTVLLIDVIKAQACAWPRIESDTHIMSIGVARPLEDAFRIAQRDLVEWVSRRCRLSLMDAYQLVSQLVESPIGNVCDAGYTSVAKVRKDWLPAHDADPTHARLRALALDYLQDH